MHAEQLDLTAIVLGKTTIERRFRQYHAAHPEVYRELVQLARQAKAAGRTRMGMKALFEILRWNRMLNGVDPEGFKLNNIFSSRYTRLICEQEPDLADLFQTRELKSA